MSAQLLSFPTTTTLGHDGQTAVNAARGRAYRRRLRFRLAVLGLDVGDVVGAAGGWLFDRSMAGWDVTVVAADVSHCAAAHILGAQVLNLQSALRARGKGPRPQAIAVSAELFNTNGQLREGIAETLRDGQIEVSVWGRLWPDEVSDCLAPTEHHLTRAALAFKRSALAATGQSHDPVCAIEVFRTGRVLRCLPNARDLVPAG